MRPAAYPQAFETGLNLDQAQTDAIRLLTKPSDRGAFLWGPVGRGKTWLLDAYFDGVATEAKKRVHFHSFFRDLHASYFRHGFSIDGAVDDLLGEIELLCFDEFHVHDIGDARLIARMLDALFARNIVLVVTSNYAPDELLPNPLFHEAFVPTITLLKDHLDEIPVNGPVDYRMHSASTSRFSTGIWTTAQPSGGITFTELCETPRSAADYLALFDGAIDVTITGIPPLFDVDPEAIQRFSNLVDVLYDRDIATTFHSTVDWFTFAEGFTGRDVDRTLSRLGEVRPTEAKAPEDRRDAHS